MTRLRIAHIAPPTQPVTTTKGGALGRRIMAMAAEQAAQYDVIVYSLPGPAAPPGAGFRIVFLRCRLPRPWRDLEFLLRVQLRLRRDGVQVLHSHAVPLAGLLVGVRSVLTVDYVKFRGWASPIGSRVYQRALRRFQHVVLVSSYCLEQFSTVWGHDLRTTVVGNGVNLELFRPDEVRGAQMRREWGVNDDEIVVLYVGRLSEQKGTDLLLEAYQLLQPRDRIRLVLIGPEGDFDPVLAHAQTPISKWRTVKDPDGVLTLGAVEDSVLPAAFNAADIAVLPTRRYEMFGMAIVEAQASGVPAVASHSQGLLETVDPLSGWWFATGDANDLARVLHEATDLGRQTLRQRGQSARGFAKQFAWSEIVQAYEKLYADQPDPPLHDNGRLLSGPKKHQKKPWSRGRK
jgi:glycosyltransferase involved in cell wall biosynthesis